MIAIVVALLLVVAPSALASPVAGLVLRLDAGYTAGQLRVIASAVNESAESVSFCGRWRFELDYVPSPETVVRIAREDSIARAGSEYRRWEGIRAPSAFDLGDLVVADHAVDLVPGAAYSDTLAIPLSEDAYRRWPGELEIRFHLDLCDGGAAEECAVPRNGKGGTLAARIPVPLGRF